MSEQQFVARQSIGGGRTRVCKRCKFSTSDGKEFLHHQLNAHSTESIEVYACEKCDYISHAYNDLIQHKRTLHPVAPSSTSSSTTTTSSSSSSSSFSKPSPRIGDSSSYTSLLPNRQVDDTNNNTNKATGFVPVGLRASSPDAAEDLYNDPSLYGNSAITYTCDKCGSNTKSSRSHLRHVREEHDPDLDVYECELCDYATRYKSRLQKHVQLRHSDGDTYTDSVEVVDEVEEEYTEGVSEDFIPEGEDEDSNHSGTLQIDEDDGKLEHDFKSPLQIVMEMNRSRGADSNSLFSSAESKMTSASFIAAMNSSLGSKGNPSMVPSRRLPAVGRPRCTPVREAVDPAKYMTVQEGDGIKYACSKCGNIYKWRKSLNKHWKEKHDGEVPDPRSSAVTALSIPTPQRMGNMQNASRLMAMVPRSQSILIPSKPGAFRSVNSALSSTARASAMYGVPVTSAFNPTGLTRPVMYRTPQVPRSLSGLNTGSAPRPPVTSNSMTSSFHPSSSALSFIRPPVSRPSPENSPIPSIPPAAHAHKQSAASGSFLSPPSSRKSSTSTSVYDEPFDEQEGVLDLSKKSKLSPGAPHTPPPQDEPLDFSGNSPPRPPFPPPPLSTPMSRRHLLSPGIAVAVAAAAASPPSLRPVLTSPHSPIVIEPADTPPSSASLLSSRHCCSVCPYTSDSPRELSDHMQLHLSARRTVRCAECPEAYITLDELNVHFSMCHVDVLQTKLNEALDSSPVLQQQLYHYLCMEPAKRPPSTSVPQETTCLVCGAYFQWQDALAAHFATSHSELPNPYSVKPPKRMTCSMCNFSTLSIKELAAHHQVNHQVHHNDINITGEDNNNSSPYSVKGAKRMTCSMCNYTTLSVHELAAHHQVHHHENNNITSEDNNNTSHVDTLLQQAREERKIAAAAGTTSSAASSSSKSLSPTPSSSEKSSDLMLTPDGKMLGFEDENTAIVIPMAPEDSMTTPKKKGRKSGITDKVNEDSSAELLLPYKCTVCEYRARWPSEITQHMKNHSDEKPYKCPRCSYRSKWKWDVVKHLKRCGGGTVKDVIDTTKIRRQQHVNAILDGVPSLGASPEGLAVTHGRELSRGPPNVTVMPSSRESSEARDGEEESPAEDTDCSESNTSMGTQPMQQHFCGQCPFIGNSIAELKRHQRVHSEDKPFICKTCGYCSKWKCDLKKHLRTYGHQSAVPLVYGGHGRKPADWEKENKADTEEDGSDQNDSTMFHCSECQYSTSKKHMFESHMNMHSSPSPNKGGKLKCKQCDFTSDDLPSFLQHKISHQAQTTNKVPEDLMSSPMKHRRKPLKQDITKTQVHESAESGDSREADEEMYPCEWCTFTADRSEQLYYHVREEHPEDMLEGEDGDEEMPDMGRAQNGVYSCDWCTWTTEKSSELYYHVRAEHREDLDDEDMAELSIYRGETRKVAKRRLKRCDKCSYVTDNVSTLQRHVSKHGKNAKYACDYCDYSVEREHIIEYHMSMVHKDKYEKRNGEVNEMKDVDLEENSMDSEQTEIQGSDGEQDDIKEEEEEKKKGITVLQIHRGNRTKYSCQKCPYKSENLTNMANHAKQHGANKKYMCEFCDYSLDQLRHIINHMKTLHESNQVTEDERKDNGESVAEVSDGDGEAEEEEMSDVSENEWEIVEEEMSNEEESPSKRRRLSRISTGSAVSTVLKYTCKTCGFYTVNKALVAKHNHREEAEAEQEKEVSEQEEDSEENINAKEHVDINRNSTNSDQAVPAQ